MQQHAKTNRVLRPPKNRLAKSRGCAGWAIKMCTQLWREAHCEVNMWKNTWCPEKFWQLSRWKRAHGYGTKHISKSKMWKKTPEVGSSFSTWAVKRVHDAIVGFHSEPMKAHAGGKVLQVSCCNNARWELTSVQSPICFQPRFLSG